jgi:hypothetical protein
MTSAGASARLTSSSTTSMTDPDGTGSPPRTRIVPLIDPTMSLLVLTRPLVEGT